MEINNGTTSDVIEIDSDNDKSNEDHSRKNGDVDKTVEDGNTIENATEVVEDLTDTSPENGSVEVNKISADKPTANLTVPSIETMEDTWAECLMCNKTSSCPYNIKIPDIECYLCSQKCLDQLQARCLEGHIFKTETKIDVEEVKLICENCGSGAFDNILSTVSWEELHFCKESCFVEYQQKNCKICTECNSMIAENLLAKYSVRFGKDIFLFCNSSCLTAYKSKNLHCSFCFAKKKQPDENRKTYNSLEFCSAECKNNFESRVQNMPTNLRATVCIVCQKKKIAQIEVLKCKERTDSVYLCSELCFKTYCYGQNVQCGACMLCKRYFDKKFLPCSVIMRRGEPLTFCTDNCKTVYLISTREKVTCSECPVKKYKYDMITRKVKSDDTKTKTLQDAYLCSVSCFKSHKPLKSLSGKCDNCLINDQKMTIRMADNGFKSFCNHSCLSAFKDKKTPTTIRLKSTSSLLDNKVIQGKDKVVINSRAPAPTPVIKVVQTQSTTSRSPQLLAQLSSRPQSNNVAIILTMKNSSTQCNPACKTIGVACKPETSDAETQTDEINKMPILIPAPVMVPVIVVVPVPVLVPVPAPVPVLLPVPCENGKSVAEAVEKIYNSVPSDPLEAEVLELAKSLASDVEYRKESQSRDSLSNESQSDSDGACGTNAMDDGDDSDESETSTYLEKRRKRKLFHDNDDDDDDGSESSTKRSKVDCNKEKLAMRGMKAWQGFATMWNKNLESGGVKLNLNLATMSRTELCAGLTLFMKNAKKPEGSEYRMDTKFYLTLAMQCYLNDRNRKENIFFDPFFAPFTDTLDNAAKEFLKEHPNYNTIVTRIEEEHLWESKVLGSHSPNAILFTLIYYHTKYFHLSTVEEHKELGFSSILKHWKEDPLNHIRTPFLRYVLSQTTLDAHPNFSRSYDMHANSENPLRCPVKIYKFYLKKCPEIVKSRSDIFYLEPERSCIPESPVWFTSNPVSDETLSRILNRIKLVREINIAFETECSKTL